MQQEVRTRPDLSALRIDDHARPRGRGRRSRLWVIAVVVAAALVGGATLALTSRSVKVTVAAVRNEESRPVLLNASGYVTPRRRATVAAKITAQVDRMYADEGMIVREGQVLAELDCADARKRLDSAVADRAATEATLEDLRVNLSNADRELGRTQSLQRGGVMSEQALDLARTTDDSLRARIVATDGQVKAAVARVRIAEQDVANCTVRSPFAGIVVSKDAQRGEMVSPISAGGGFTRTGIATVVDMNSLEIEVDVNEANIARVEAGRPVVAVLDAYPDWEIPGKVRTVIPTADRQKATVKVRITFDHLDPRILPDMGCKVRFLADAPKEPTVAARLMPQKAMHSEAGGSFVYVYRDGQVERRAVRTGNQRGSDLEVLAGLNDGDQVVTEASAQLADKQRVELKK